jgi:hypothetical protein
MLALNVWPFPGQPSAVRVSAAGGDGYGGDAYLYPMRVADGTAYLRPEQLAMFMSPEVRIGLFQTFTPHSAHKGSYVN